MLKSQKEKAFLLSLLTRYSIILAAGLLLPLFYLILTPLTIQTLHAILSIGSEPTVTGTFIRLPTLIIEIIPACVAGAAYYLLLLLILSTPNITTRIRLRMVVEAFITLFTLNILRILYLIHIADTSYFETAHWIFWNVISTIFVLAIWILLTKKHQIKKIPVLTDIQTLLAQVKR